MIEAGSKTEQVVSALDLLPTLTSSAGISHAGEKPLDGVDMWPAIRDGKTVSRPLVIVGTHGSVALIEEQWKLVRATDGALSLFDLKEDPSETSDLAGEKAELVAELQPILAPFAKMMTTAPGKPQRRRRPNGTTKRRRAPR